MAQRKFIIDGGFKTDDASELLANLTMGGTIDMAGDKILNVGVPTLSTDAASKTYVDTLVADTINSAPDALNTLNELAAALGDDANFSSTVTTALATKATTVYVDAQITGVEGYADAAEADAITAAAGDATTKANAAEANATATAAADATSKDDVVIAAYIAADANVTTAMQSYADTAEVDAVATAATAAQVKVDALESSLTHFHSAVTDITDAADTTYTFSELTNARHYVVFLNRLVLRANEYSVSGTTVTLVAGTHDVGDELEVTGFSS